MLNGKIDKFQNGLLKMYDIIKVFNIQNMPESLQDKLCSYFYSEECCTYCILYDGKYFHIYDEDLRNELNNWLIDNGYIEGEEVVIKF